MRRLVPFVALALAMLLAAPGLSAQRDTFTIGRETGILLTFDPAVVYEVFGAALVDQLYDNLVVLELEGGQIQPRGELAESWAISEDGRQWTFTLREGPVFPGGGPVDAEAVAFSFRRAVLLDQGPAWLIKQLGITPENVDQTVEVLDARRVRLTFDNAYAPNIILSILAFPLLGIVDPAVIAEREVDGDLAAAWMVDHSAGSGPYFLQRWERNRLVEMVANESYWRGAPAIKRILVQDVPEPSTLRLLVERGDLDSAWGLPPQTAAEIERRNPANLRVVKIPNHGLEYLAMNVSFEPFSDPRVREAVRYAIDYETIREQILNGQALNVQTFIPTGYLGHDPQTPFQQDLDRARQLLAEAGYAGGFSATLLTSSTYPRQDVAVKLQSDLAQVGIRVEIQTLNAGPMYELYRTQGHQMILAGWGVDYPDPDALAKPFADWTARQLAWRNAWYDDHASELSAVAMIEPDTGTREALYHQLTEYVLHQGPFAILYQPLDTYVVNTRVQGFEEAAALNNIHMDFTRISKSE